MAKDGRLTRQQRRALERKNSKSGRTATEFAAGAAIALGTAAFATAAGAATITVNSGTDVSTAGDAQCTLREALANANDPAGADTTGGDCAPGSIGADTIVFSSAVTGTITLSGSSLPVTDSVTIQGPGPATLAIDAAGASQIFNVVTTDPTASVSITGLTMQNGNSPGGGGAVFASGGNLTLTNDVIQNNTAKYGGGVALRGESSVTISDTTITGNSAFGNGGGIAVKYGIGPVTLTNVTINGKNTAGFGGGGIYAGVYCGGSLTISSSVISGNNVGGAVGGPPVSPIGGGIAVYNRLGPPAVVGLVSKAKASSVHGAPGRRSAPAPCPVDVSVTDSTVSDNVVIPNSTTYGGLYAGYGGGIAVDNQINLNVTRTTISGNTGGYTGGGIAAQGYSVATINNSTIVNNKALYDGGGISLETSVGHITDTTISGNSLTGVNADTGAGISVTANYYASLQASDMSNSIVAGNTTTAPANVYYGTDIYVYSESKNVALTVSFTDVGNPGTTPQWTDGGGNIFVDPLLGPLQDNGGPTQGNGGTFPTLTELPGPPVIDKGSNALVVGATDQRGFQRIQGAAVDMGAVETPADVISFSSPTYTVNENGTTATITVTRTGAGNGAVTVNYATSNGTATAGADYTPATGTLTWLDGDTTPKTFSIPIIDDTLIEGNETVNLTLSSPTGGSLGTSAAVLTIVDVEAGIVTTNPAVTVNEAAGTVTITLNRTNGSTGPITVNFSTANGTATSPADFTATSGSVTFADGDTAPKTITIPIILDGTIEAPETFTLNLSSATPGAVATPVVTVTIIDPASIPTLAFWMKLMLLMTVAGVGVVMLKNGRVLVIVAATGLALAAAPKLHAAPKAAHTHAAKKHHRTATTVAGSLASITTDKGVVTATVGTTSVTIQSRRFQVIDMRSGRRARLAPNTPAGGAASVLVVRKGKFGHTRRVTVILYDTLAHAQQAAQKLARP
jgi:hypothetical protein